MDSDRCNGTCLQRRWPYVYNRLWHYISGISMHSFTVISSEENSAYFLQVQPITACTVTTISFHRVPIGLSVQGQHWLETSTSTSIYDLWWDLLILNFMFFLISHNFHSYDCYSIMMTVMSRLWLNSDSSAVLWYAVMKYCRRRILWQNCMSLKVI